MSCYPCSFQLLVFYEIVARVSRVGEFQKAFYGNEAYLCVCLACGLCATAVPLRCRGLAAVHYYKTPYLFKRKLALAISMYMENILCVWQKPEDFYCN